MFSFSTALRGVVHRVLDRLLDRHNSRHALISVRAILSLHGRVVSLPIGQTRVSLQVSRSYQSGGLFSRAIARTGLVVTEDNKGMSHLTSTLGRFQPFRQSIIRHQERARTVFSRHTFTANVTFMRNTSLQRNGVQFIGSR